MWARLCHLGVTRVVLCSTRSGLPVSHRAGDLRAELEGSLLRFIANAAWVTCIAPKTAESLFELILAHRARQKCGPSLGVGVKPTAANQLKRGGFLEVRPKQSHCRVGSNLQSAPISKFSSQISGQRFSSTTQLTAAFKALSTLANLHYFTAHVRICCPIGGGVSIVSPSRKPALACRAGPVLPSMGDRERTRPAV